MLVRAAAVAIALATSAEAQRLYWTNAAGHLQSATLDGEDVLDLVPISGLGLGVAIDGQAGRIYWGQQGPGVIRSCDLCGDDVQNVITGIDQPIAIALDVPRQNLYWTDDGDVNGINKLRRVMCNGTGPADFQTGLASQLTGIDFEPYSQQVYWTMRNSGAIERVAENAPSGTMPTVLVTGLGCCIEDIAVDYLGGKMYWTEQYGQGHGAVRCANIDGTQVTTLVSDPLDVQQPDAIVLDLSADKMYWTDQDLHAIRCASLDGNNVQVVVPGVVALGLDIGPPPTPGSSNYCSTGATGATMSLAPGASTSVAANNLIIQASPVTSTFGLFFFGDSKTAVPFGAGTRCVAAPVFRCSPATIPVGGVASRQIDLTTLPGSAIIPASCWNFQYWFRRPDLVGAVDFSNGLDVVFGP